MAAFVGAQNRFRLETLGYAIEQVLTYGTMHSTKRVQIGLSHCVQFEVMDLVSFHLNSGYGSEVRSSFHRFCQTLVEVR